MRTKIALVPALFIKISKETDQPCYLIVYFAILNPLMNLSLNIIVNDIFTMVPYITTIMVNLQKIYHNKK